MIYIVRNRLIHQIFKQFYSYKHTQKNLKLFVLIITKVCTSKLWLSYYFTTACKTKLYHWCIESLSITHTWYSTVKLLSLSLVRWLGSLNHFAPVAQRLVRSAAPGCSSAVCRYCDWWGAGTRDTAAVMETKHCYWWNNVVVIALWSKKYYTSIRTKELLWKTIFRENWNCVSTCKLTQLLYFWGVDRENIKRENI